MTLEKAWTHVKPNVSPFREFGSTAWDLILDEKHKAMEKKSQPLIFVGYCEDMKAYRLFDPSSKDVLFRRDAIFDEDFTPISSPSPSSTWNVDYVTDHDDNFLDQEDDFVVEHHVTKDEN